MNAHIKSSDIKMVVYWSVATAVAAILMLGYVHGFIYPRTEAEKLEKAVDKNTARLENTSNQLNVIEGKIDTMIQFLKQSNRKR